MSHAPDRSLRAAHRILLAMVGLCALISWLQPGTPQPRVPGAAVVTVAFALGLAVVLLRGSASSPVIPPRARVSLLLSAYACAFGLALLGAWLATTQEQPRVGAGFGLAAGIFCLRPPPPLGRSA